MNKVQLIGRVTKDIDLRYTPTGVPVVRFTLAVNRPKKDSGADFISCTAWNKTAENMDKYIGQGDQVAVVGHIQTGSYEKDGHKVYTTDVMCENVEFLQKKGSHQQTEDQADQTPETDSDGFMDIPDGVNEELPFQ